MNFASLSIVSFSARGSATMEKIAKALQEFISEGGEFSAETFECFGKKHRTLGEFTERAFSKKTNGRSLVVFVGAVGIAVRAIAPFVKKKTEDPAVVCVDEKASFAIPILSGHIGGANDAARAIAVITGALPVITTATDINGAWAVDSWAVENGFGIENARNIKLISAKILAKLPVRAIIDDEESTEAESLRKTRGLELSSRADGIDALFSTAQRKAVLFDAGEERRFVLGIGCRKGTDAGELLEFVRETLGIHKIKESRIEKIATIDIKKNEPAILSLAELLNVPLIFFTAEELGAAHGNFSDSEFVRKTVGVGNVCERSVALSGAFLAAKKKSMRGMTIAIGIIG